MTSVTTSIGATNSVAGGTTPSAEKAQLLKTAKAFEAIFLRQMIGEMRSTTLSDDDVLGSSGSEQFRELGDAKMADNLSEKGAFGIAALLLKQLDKGLTAAGSAVKSAYNEVSAVSTATATGTTASQGDIKA